MFLLFSLRDPLHIDVDKMKQIWVINGFQYADYFFHDTPPSWILSHGCSIKSIL